MLGPGSPSPISLPNKDGVEGVEVCGVSGVRNVGATHGVGGWKNRGSTGSLLSVQYQILCLYDHWSNRSSPWCLI